VSQRDSLTGFGKSRLQLSSFIFPIMIVFFSSEERILIPFLTRNLLRAIKIEVLSIPDELSPTHTRFFVVAFFSSSRLHSFLRFLSATR